MINYIEIRDTDRELLGTVRASSIIWRTEYQGAGSFEIQVPYTDQLFAWLTPNNYITRTGSTELGFIESVELNYSVEQGRIITASGSFGLTLLSRRIYYDRSGYTCRLKVVNSGTTIEDACRSVVGNTLIASNAERNVTWLSLGTNHSYAETTTRHESTYTNVLEFVKTLLAEGDLGHRVVFDRDTLTAEYEVIKGKNAEICFSQKYNNLLTFNYSYDMTLYKTKFLIGGEGSGADRFYSGTSRVNVAPEQVREYFYDSSVSKTYNDNNGNQQTYTDAQYSSALVQDCKGQFKENSTQEKISGTVDLTAYIFGADYNVGDIVRIIDTDTGINTTARIWSVTEIQDENGYRIEANFEEAV